MAEVLQVNVGGTWETVLTLELNVGGVWTRVDTAEYNDSGVWKDFFYGLSVSDDGPATAATDGTRAPAAGNVTVTPANGAGSETYAWTYISGDADVAIDDSTAAATFWTVPSNPAGKDASWRCTVTDAHGETITTDVTVSFPSST